MRQQDNLKKPSQALWFVPTIVSTALTLVALHLWRNNPTDVGLAITLCMAVATGFLGLALAGKFNDKQSSWSKQTNLYNKVSEGALSTAGKAGRLTHREWINEIKYQDFLSQVLVMQAQLERKIWIIPGMQGALLEFSNHLIQMHVTALRNADMKAIEEGAVILRELTPSIESTLKVQEELAPKIDPNDTEKQSYELERLRNGSKSGRILSEFTTSQKAVLNLLSSQIKKAEADSLSRLQARQNERVETMLENTMTSMRERIAYNDLLMPSSSFDKKLTEAEGDPGKIVQIDHHKIG